MAFPTNPSVGQTHTANGETWEYNGVGWQKLIFVEIDAVNGLEDALDAKFDVAGGKITGSLEVEEGVLIDTGNDPQAPALRVRNGRWFEFDHHGNFGSEHVSYRFGRNTQAGSVTFDVVFPGTITPAVRFNTQEAATINLALQGTVVASEQQAKDGQANNRVMTPLGVDRYADENLVKKDGGTVGDIHATTSGAWTLPAGTNAQRPTASQGMIRYNTSIESFEGFNGSEWGAIGGEVDLNTNNISDNSQYGGADLTTSLNVIYNTGVGATSNGAWTLPAGSNAQRPSPSQAMIRYNTSINNFEGYDGSSWNPLGQQDLTASVVENDSNLSGSTVQDVFNDFATVGLPFANQLTSSHNLNNIIPSNRSVEYYHWTQSSSPTNAPGGAAGFMKVMSPLSGRATQVVHRRDTYETWVRYYDGSSWSTFVRHLTTDDDLGANGTMADLDAASTAQARAYTNGFGITTDNLRNAPALVSWSGGSNISVNWESFLVATVTLTGNRTLFSPSNVIPGTSREVIVKGNSSTNGRTLSFGGNYLDPPGVIVWSTFWMKLTLFAETTSSIWVKASPVEDL